MTIRINSSKQPEEKILHAKDKEIRMTTEFLPETVQDKRQWNIFIMLNQQPKKSN